MTYSLESSWSTPPTATAQAGFSQTVDRALENALEDLVVGDFQARWETAKRLSAFGEPVIQPLLERLRDDELDWEVRWFAARILGDFDQAEVVSALLDLFETAEDDELRQGAADALTHIGPSSVTALSQLLQDPARKEVAARAIAQIRHSSTVSPLLILAQDEAASLRAIALEALGGYQDTRIGPIVQAALSDPASKVRIEAVRALGNRRGWLGQADPVDLLEPCLQDLNLEVCQAAIASLGRLSTDRSAELLLRLVQTSTTPAPLQQTAIQALGWMETPTALTGLLTLWTEVPTQQRSTILAALSRQSDPGLRQQAAKAVMQWLIALDSRPEHSRLRQQAALTLGQLGWVEASPLLQTLASDPDEAVSLHAIAALRSLGNFENSWEG